MNPKRYEKGKYEFEKNEEDDDDNDEEFEDYNEDDEFDDELFNDYKIIERTRMKKNKKKVIRHHSIKELFKNG